MIAIPHALVNPAKEAGISVPDDPQNYDDKEFPRWHLFCCAQLGQPMPDWSCCWSNAKVIAALPAKKLKTVTMEQLVKKGFAIGYPIP